VPTTNKYNSAVVSLGRGLPSWVTDTDDQSRVAAYDAYDDMYKNVPDTFKVVMRGTDDRPVYIPSAMKIIEATNRYLGKEWNWSVAAVGPDAQVQEAGRAEVELALGNLAVREEFLSKFYSLKRNMLKRGDAFLHITANLGRAPGRRLSITELSARSVFWITSALSEEEKTGVYIVDLIYADDGTTQIARRMEYRYNESGGVDARLTFWETNAWDDRWTGHPALKPVAIPTAYKVPDLTALLSGYTLPNTVTTIPVYHFRNRREGGEPFGTSQIAGVETLIAAINQTVSDEDITLALQGLGVYMTDSARPVNDAGEEIDWEISPGVVLEMKLGSKMARIDGVGSVIPFQDHLKYLGDEMQSSTGLSSTAVGEVDVSVAASGVALRLDMAPILAQNEEKEAELLDRLDQMMFDLLTQWMPLEQVVTVQPGIKITNSFSDPLPIDRAGIIAEIVQLVTAGLMSREFAIAYLTAKLGYQFPSDMLAKILNEEDTVAARLAAEALGGAVSTDDGAGNIAETPPGVVAAAPTTAAPVAV
jgi:hypothetical protein